MPQLFRLPCPGKKRGPQNHFPIAYFQALDCLFRTDLDRTEEYQIKMLSPGYLLDQSSTAAHSKISDRGLLVRKNRKTNGFFHRNANVCAFRKLMTERKTDVTRKRFPVAGQQSVWGFELFAGFGRTTFCPWKSMHAHTHVDELVWLCPVFIHFRSLSICRCKWVQFMR